MSMISGQVFGHHRKIQPQSMRLVASLCCVAGLGGLLLLSSVYCSKWRQAVFFTTNSPNHTYEVKLKGQKGRPLLIANAVRADIFKEGRPFISDLWVHSTQDPLDLSFEAGYPDTRWSTENVVEFYRQEYYESGRDSLVVTNRSTKSILWLRIQSVNKVFIFEMHAGSSIQVELPAPRGDSQWIAAEGAFTDGQKIDFTPQTFDRRGSQTNHHIYQIVITGSGLSIES